MSQALAIEHPRPWLPKKLTKYFAVVKISYLTNTAYIEDMLSIGVLVAMRVWLFTQLYTVVFRQVHATTIGGLSLPMTVWSLALGQSILMSNRTRVLIRAITQEIQSGNIAYSISRPYNYIIFYCFHNLGTVFAYLIANVGLSGLACLLLVGPIHFSFLGILCGAVLLLGGVLINILIAISIGLTAFWSEDTTAFQRIYGKTQLIFGGVIVPLSLFPTRLRQIAEILPLGQAFYAPARLMVSFDLNLFFRFLILQASWLLILGFITSLIFKKGVKNVSINGG